ncbi:MAG: MBL fold metallo-hydrolase [archaeon]
MKISALASGSSGNCFYVCNNKSGILIDCGISSKQVEERLSILKQNPEKIKGIFVTHEHIDHIRGVDVLARKFSIPIFATKKTIKNSLLCQNEDLICPIKNDETVCVDGMNVEAFSKSHDASDPVSYKIKNGKVLSVVTDIGYACENVIESVRDSDFLVIESNHDLDMLESGKYPYFLKQRILGDTGHLSNKSSALCVLEHAKSKMKNVILAHLSENNNTPLAAMNSFGLLRERTDLRPKVSLSLRNCMPLMSV